MHPYIQTVLDNLKAASNPDDQDHDFPLSHFQKFLNWEREGLTWFLYEVVTMRYMWGGTRLDYVRDLVAMDEIHLDEGFPTFPGSPKNHRTVRKFLQDSLSADELELVDMMPALVPQTTPVTPSRPIRRQSEAPNAPERPHRPYRPLEVTVGSLENNSPSYGQIEILLLRKNQKNDDKILIKKYNRLFEESYSVTYMDRANSAKRFTYLSANMTRQQVLDYLSTTLRLLAVDEEPYSNVQLNLPGAPPVMLPIDMDSYTRNLFYDSVENTMNAWPILL